MDANDYITNTYLSQCILFLFMGSDWKLIQMI